MSPLSTLLQPHWPSVTETCQAHSCLRLTLELFPPSINFPSLTLAWPFPSCHSAYKCHFSERPFLTPSINLPDHSYQITLIFYSHCTYSIILIFYCSLICCLSALKCKLHKKRPTLSYSLLYPRMEKDAQPHAGIQ